MAIYNLLLIIGSVLILSGITLPIWKNHMIIKYVALLLGICCFYPGVLILIREINGGPQTTLMSTIMVVFSWVVLGFIFGYKAIQQVLSSPKAP